MRRILFIVLLFLIINPLCKTDAKEYLYILNDECINELFVNAEKFFQNTAVTVIRDPQGILLRFELKYPLREYESMSIETYKKLLYIHQFLAKIKNPAIIEVHTGNLSESENNGLKKWEVSTVIANRIESVILDKRGGIEQTRIHSIGYGEFLPAQNTSNNGGNYPNRVDIMILCNISGE